MVKKNEKGPAKDPKQLGAPVEDELSKSPADLSLPHTCTGHFNVDFTELCKRLQPTPFCVPLVIARPHRPASPVIQQAIEEKPVKGSKAGKKENMPIPELSDVEIATATDTGEIPEQPPKTYTTKDRLEYFKPCVQVEMEIPDKFDTVTEVYIRGWKVDEPMLDVLSQCWTNSGKLTTISLWSTGLTDGSIETLSSLLPVLPTLRSLILDNNPSVGDSWHLLIKDEFMLQHLSLRYNAITDDVTEKIGNALGSISNQNHNLLMLNLAGNRITDKGAVHLAAGLRFNRNLLTLSLNGNQIGDQGAKCIAEVISRFPLTHKEIVARRRLLYDKIIDDKPRRSESPLGKKERPGSVMTTISSTSLSSSTLKSTSSSRTLKSKKTDGKLSKDEEKAKGKTTKEPAKKVHLNQNGKGNYQPSTTPQTSASHTKDF